MKVNIYLKSSIKGFKAQNGVVCFVLSAAGQKDLTLTQFGLVKNVTDNQAHLIALKYALSHINDKSDLVIWTDNSYIAAAFEQDWIKGWKDRDFKTVKGKEIANKTEWEEVLTILGDTIPKFEISKSHEFKNWMSDEVERRAKKYV